MERDTPLVGICIPVYENVELLDRAIRSILLQQYKNYIICITDDSKSNAVELYIKKYKNVPIVYRHNEKQLGASGNTNKALELAMGNNVELIKILYQDDWFTYEDSLEKMINKLLKDNADILFCGNLEVYKNYTREHICTKDMIDGIRNDLSCLFRANCLGAPSNILYKTQKLFLDSTYTWLLDIDFYLRLIPDKKMEYLYEPLMSIGHDGEQLTDFYAQHPCKMFRETFRQYMKYSWLHTGVNRKYLIGKGWKCLKEDIKIKLRCLKKIFMRLLRH